MHDAQITKWDVINHWKTDQHILAFLQVALADGWPPLIAAALVDIARAKRALDTAENPPHGQSRLEKAINDAQQRPAAPVSPKTQTDGMPIARKTDADYIRALQSALADGSPEATAAILAAIARSKGLLSTAGDPPGGQSQLEKAIANSRRRHSFPPPITPAETPTTRPPP